MAKTKIKEVAIGTYSDYYLRLYYEETNVSNVNNTSSVTISLYGYTERSSSICSYNNGGGNTVTVVVDGTTSTLSGQNIDTRDWHTEKLLHSYTKTITHGADGSKSITVSGSITYQGGGTSLTAGTYSTGNVSQSLTTIARASTVGTVSNTAITSTSGNVKINISKKNSAYYDRITTTGAISKTINVGTGTSGTISWSDLLGSMTSTTSATLNITVSTYSNSGYTTLIGSNTGKATITINTSNIKPSISWGSIAVNSGGLSGKLVAGKSTAKATWTVTNATGASVSSVTVSATNGSIGSGASSTSTSGTPTTAVLPSNTSNYNLTLTATVKDSRGATATATTSAATVYGYAPPNLTLTAYRTATSSSTAQDPTGAYVYTTWSASVGSTVGGSNAIASTTKTPSSITSGGHYSLATNATQAFTVTVKDTVGSTTSKTVNIGTALIPFDLYSNAAGTSVGVGVGTVAKADRFTSALPAYFDDEIVDSYTAEFGRNTGSGDIGWYEVASGTITGYSDRSAIILFNRPCGPQVGIYYFRLRCDNNDSLRITSNGWLVRYGYSADHVKMRTSGNDWHLYVYQTTQYGKTYARILGAATTNTLWTSLLLHGNETVLTSDPGGTAATDIGVVGNATDSNAVHLTGNANITGIKWFITYPVVWGTAKGNAPRIKLATANDEGAENASYGVWSDTTNGNPTQLIATIKSYSSSTYKSTGAGETYRFPVVDADISAEKYYSVLTSKSAVTVAQGGTGATSAANARSNLGVNQPTLSSAQQINGNSTVTFNVTTANYLFYLFKFSMNGVVTTIFNTRDMIDTTAQTYWVNDGTSTGAGMIITRTASGFTVKRNGSTSCWCRLAYWN